MRTHERILATIDRQPTDRFPVDVLLAAEVLECYLETSGDLIAIAFLSDDMGAQSGLLISTKAYAEFFKPRLKNVLRVIETVLNYRVDCGKRSWPAASPHQFN